MTPASRLITLIMLLQRQPNQKASALAKELGVSVRTLHRYFAMLDEMGIPIYSDRGPYGGFSLVRGYKMPPLVFTPQEAVAIALGAGLVEQVWGPAYRDAARAALAKLENLLPEEHCQEIAWARRSLAAAGMLRSDLSALQPHLETLRGCMRSLVQVDMLYLSAGRLQPEWRRFDPYALVYRSGWWYAVGYCHLREALRSFRLDRIQQLAPTDQAFTLQPGFDLQAYLAAEQQALPSIKVRLLFSASMAHVAQANRALWEAVRPRPDGSLEVEATFPDLDWAASTTLAYGPLVTALAPPELKLRVKQWAMEIVERNS